MRHRKPTVYLAGPEVFLADAAAVGEAKKAICARYGLAGLFPLDNELYLGGMEPHAAGIAISKANEALMRKADLVIANITPFRGPGMDPGHGLRNRLHAGAGQAGVLLHRERSAARRAGGALGWSCRA